MGCRCGLWYRASKSQNARASYWHILAGSIWIGSPLVVLLLVVLNLVDLVIVYIVLKYLLGTAVCTATAVLYTAVVLYKYSSTKFSTKFSIGYCNRCNIFPACVDLYTAIYVKSCADQRGVDQKNPCADPRL